MVNTPMMRMLHTTSRPVIVAIAAGVVATALIPVLPPGLPVLAAGFSVALTFSAGAQSSPWQIAPAVQNTAKDSAAKDTPADDAEAAAGDRAGA